MERQKSRSMTPDEIRAELRLDEWQWLSIHNYAWAERLAAELVETRKLRERVAELERLIAAERKALKDAMRGRGSGGKVR